MYMGVLLACICSTSMPGAGLCPLYHYNMEFSHPRIHMNSFQGSNFLCIGDWRIQADTVLCKGRQEVTFWKKMKVWLKGCFPSLSESSFGSPQV